MEGPMPAALDAIRDWFSVFPWLSEPKWIALNAMVSMLAAIATVVLALYTRRMAKETKDLGRDTLDAADRADEHHQQSLWPFVALTSARVFGKTLIVELHNVGPGFVTRGTVSVVQGSQALDPMKTLGKFGPMSVGSVSTVSIPNADVAFNAEGRPLELIAVRVGFESVFHSTGHTDWLVELVMGNVSAADFSTPPIIKRATLDALQRST
jgi:hypothetical protein